jgi:ATP-binding cassette subfamily B protein
VLPRPALLVLDDPLSALDLHTEAEVERALRKVLRDVTALVVAHRPNTARMADRVAVLADGRILAVGTHGQLLDSCPHYRALMATPADTEARPSATPDTVRAAPLDPEDTPVPQDAGHPDEAVTP